MSYVIKLPANRFETLQLEPEFAQYIGISSLDGVRFPTNAFPFIFNTKEDAERYMKASATCIYMRESIVEEFEE